MRPPRPILNLAVAMAAVMLAAATARAHAAPQMQPTCKNFGFVTEWKGTLSLVGTGSGTLSDGGTYSINESIRASPDLAMGGAPTWTGTFNETIHIDDMESHPDGTFTHITDDETIPLRSAPPNSTPPPACPARLSTIPPAHGAPQRHHADFERHLYAHRFRRLQLRNGLCLDQRARRLI